MPPLTLADPKTTSALQHWQAKMWVKLRPKGRAPMRGDDHISQTLGRSCQRTVKMTQSSSTTQVCSRSVPQIT